MDSNNKLFKTTLIVILILNYCGTVPTTDLHSDCSLGSKNSWSTEEPDEISSGLNDNPLKSDDSTDMMDPFTDPTTDSIIDSTINLITERTSTSTLSTVKSSKSTSLSTTTTKKTRTSTTTPSIPTTVETTATPQCNTNGEYNGQYGIESWPPVGVGMSSNVSCPSGKGNVVWNCTANGVFDKNGPDWTDCYAWLDELPKLTDLINAIEVTEIISNKTEQNNTIIDSEKLIQVMSIITEVQTFVNNVTDVDLDDAKTYASNIIDSLSHIIDQKYAWTNATAQQKTRIASSILLYVQYSSFTLACKQNGSNRVERIRNENIHINTFVMDTSKELVFPLNTKNSSIVIPRNIKFNDTEIKCNNTAIGAVINSIQDYLSTDIHQDEEINSEILSFSLINTNRSVQLSDEVTIRLKHINKMLFGDQIQCVYWDFDRSSWGSEGCYKVVEESDRLHTVCKCNHLTNFAALMDVSGRESNNQWKSILTYFCGILSIVGLVLTINLIFRSKPTVEMSSRRENLNEMRSIITCNLCVCLLITNMLVLFGMDRTNITWLCQLSSGLLLYSLLSSFFWMLMEGNYLYKTLVSCFKSEFNRVYLYSVGYGAPTVIIIIGFIIIGIRENIFFEALFDERYNYFCWISSSRYPNHIWILVGPAICIILLNMLLMFISLKTAFKVIRKHNSFAVAFEGRSRAKLKQIVSFIFISFLLGITWISFLLYIHRTFDFYFSYLFIVLNGSQGFFIFLYHFSIKESISRKSSTSTVSKY